MTPQLEQILAQYQVEKTEIANVDEPRRSLVLFCLGDRHFALYGSQVKELLADRPISWVPGCAMTMEGVISYRGRVESVIRLNTLLEIDSKESTGKRIILIGRGDEMQSGMLVDKLVDVLDVMESQILPPPESLPPAMRNVVVGIVNMAGIYYSLLDLNLVFERYQETSGYDVSL
ncbi:chemotaxis protein CheW [Kluyvera sp. CHPC 1.251]|uniref:chemotaxis protein CheW n=1 Tax=Kluyvera sp. CHPC 1.251 TaxID=2995175 RepID=UPI002FD7ECED